MRGVGKPPWWSLDTVVVTGWMNGWDLEVSSDVLGCRKSVTLNWQLTAAVRRTDLKLGSLNMIGLGKSCHNPSGLTGGVNTSSQLIMRANIKLWCFIFYGLSCLQVGKAAVSAVWQTSLVWGCFTRLQDSFCCDAAKIELFAHINTRNSLKAFTRPTLGFLHCRFLLNQNNFLSWRLSLCYDQVLKWIQRFTDRRFKHTV